MRQVTRPWPLRSAGLLALCLSLLLAGCSGPATTPASPTADDRTPESTAGTADEARPPSLTPVSDQALTIAGRVKSLSENATVIALEAPNEGIDRIALTPQSKVVLSDGRDGSGQDLQPGTIFQVTGLATGDGSILAQEIIVIKLQ